MVRSVSLLLVALVSHGVETLRPVDPQIHVTIRHYEIAGRTAEALRHAMNTHSPAHERGRTYDAYTSWYVEWNYRWHETSQSCAITTVTTTVDVTITLPKWVDYEEASASLQRRWDVYYAALKRHEEGHKDFGIRAAAEIEQAIAALSPRSQCDLLERDANGLGHDILHKYTRLERQYDVRTNHGMKAGAVFP